VNSSGCVGSKQKSIQQKPEVLKHLLEMALDSEAQIARLASTNTAQKQETLIPQQQILPATIPDHRSSMLFDTDAELYADNFEFEEQLNLTNADIPEGKNGR
jgi:hypothetical protein